MGRIEDFNTTVAIYAKILAVPTTIHTPSNIEKNQNINLFLHYESK